MKRLFREIRVLKQLDHENVVKVFHTLISTKRKNSSGSVSLKHKGLMSADWLVICLLYALCKVVECRAVRLNLTSIWVLCQKSLILAKKYVV